MKTKTTHNVSVSGIILFLFIFLGSTNSFAASGGDCDNEVTITGHVEKVISNWGVDYDWKVKNAPDGYGAHFYDNDDKLVVKLDDLLKAGQKVTITWKKRDYNSSFSGPAKLKVYESKDGSSYSYNSTLTTDVKSYFVDKMFTLNGDTKYLKLVNGSSNYFGSPDFLVDAISYSYTICNDHCPNGPEPGTPCDDGNPNTSNDVIDENCECHGTAVPNETLTVCAQVNDSRDDAEENLLTGAVSTTSSDLEFVLDGTPPNGPFINQAVGIRFNDLNIPQGATITSAFIQFTADASIGLDPCNLNIRGEASDNATAFSTSTANITSRLLTGASVLWSPPAWTAGDNDAAQQTPDIAAVIQEVVNRAGYAEGSSIAIIISGEGKRTAKSYDGSDSHAPILCVTYQTGCHDSDNDGVCDDDDMCNGFDDNIDVDHDGIPDGCDDCINEVNNSGNANKVIWNWGVYKDWKILGAPDDEGAEFFDHGDKLIVRLDGVVDKDQKIIITLKKRDYQSSYSGPSQLKVYESKNGYCWYYNKTITTEVKSYYVEKMFTLDHDTKYLKLVNGSTCYNGSPDFYVDAISYSYRLCDEVADHCPNGPEPGTACDDGNPNTINDVINGNCECAGTPVANYDICSQIAASSDDAEENTDGGGINLTSGDIELLWDDGHMAVQVVGLRFLNLNIPNSAVINSAYIQFTSEATINQDPSVIDFYGEASDNSVTFANVINNISNRPITNSTVSWSPIPWTSTGVAGPDQRSPDLAEIIQEIVNRPGYTSSSAISIIIEGIGKRTAVSFNAHAEQAAQLCINYSAPLQGGTPQGMIANDNSDIDLADIGFGINMDADPDLGSDSDITGGLNNNLIEDAPEVILIAPTSVEVYPVPASKDLKVNLSSYEGRPARISVYNQLGQLQEIFDIQEISPSPFEMNVENYTNGVYYMNIEVENAKVISKKFLVNRTY